MTGKESFDSESFLLEIAGRPIPGNLSLGKIVSELIQNSLAMEYIPKNYYPLSPEMDQVKTTLEKRNERLYKELDRREQRYTFGKDNLS